MATNMSTEGTNDAPEPERPGVSQGSLGRTPWANKTEQTFFESDAPLQRALAAGGIGSWKIDLCERRATINAQEACILGLDPGPRELSLEEFTKLTHPRDLARVAQQYWSVGRDDEEFQAEFRIVRADGEIRWLEALGGFLRDEAGEVRWVLGIHVDITERKRTEQQLRRLETRRLLAVEAAEVGDWEYDIVRDEAFWSPKACEQIGVDPSGEPTVEEVLANIHPDDRPMVDEAVDRAIDPSGDDDVYQAEFRLVHPDGEIVWVDSRGHAIFEETCQGRRPTHLVGAMVDITKRKCAERELHENRRRLKTLIENLPGMAYRCLNEPNWPFEFVSGSEFVCGYDSEAVVSGEVEWAELIHPDDRGWLWDAVQDALAVRDHFEVEYRLEHADGEYRWVWEQGSGVFEGGEVVALEGFIIDITARKMAEKELHEADQRKNKFLAMLGHELRNPLMAINSAAELLDHLDLDQPLVGRAQRIIARQSRQMARLIDGLLDVSRITQGKLELDYTVVNIIEVIQNLLEDRQEQLSSRRVEIVVDPGAEHMLANADPVRISQVFDNLLVNAIKFTDETDTIGIGLSRQGAEAVVSVEDTGAGIDEALLPHIFEPFQQAPQDIARSRGGLGLGLALARELVELHGGTIDARSEGAGHGSQFIVRLPLWDSDQSSPELNQPTRAQPCRVLLIEDNPDIVEVLTLQLEAAGCDVYSSFHAGEGLELLDKVDPDIVLCDLGLPEISGYAFAASVREERGLDELPLVALTGYGDPEAHRRALEAGFDAHVVKPVAVDRLLSLFEQLCPTPHRDEPSSRSH
ncbi:MAG: PAS domain-containing protein [Persicimonas sp.]